MRVGTVLGACGYGFLLAPLLVVAVLSLSSGRYLSFPPPGLSLQWFAALSGNGELLTAAWRSAVLGVLASLCALLAGVPAAFAVARGLAPAAVSGLLSLPLLLPTLVVGLALLLVLQPAGLLATWPGLLLGHLSVVLPFVVRLMATSFSALSPDLEEAAATLGARPLAGFLHVTLPLAAPGVIAAGALAFLLSFDETVISLFLVGPRLTTLPVVLFHYAENRADPLLAAWSVVLIVLALVVVVVVDRLAGFTRTVGRA